jgi:hypothetical protein
MRVPSSDEWQVRRCPNPGCRTTALRVRRDRRSSELWWVGRLDYSGQWRIVAAEPCCPTCGSGLEEVGGTGQIAG